jgi:hypothetical protein
MSESEAAPHDRAVAGRYVDVCWRRCAGFTRALNMGAMPHGHPKARNYLGSTLTVPPAAVLLPLA